MSERRRYSRSDLNELKSRSRAEVFEIFGSFDDRGLDVAAFVLAASRLIDPARVRGLSSALESADTDQIALSIQEACRKTSDTSGERAHPSGIAVHARHAAADEVLANRFTFYGESHQLPADFSWDDNPGTAHWGHDLNRFGYLSALTDACRQSGDDRYARKAVDLMLDWVAKCEMERCFEGTPYVFGAYLNNTIHISAWARCLETLIPMDVVEPIELLRIIKSIHDQICYLEIVTNGHAGNWPTIGCQGVLSTLAALPVLADTVRFSSYFISTLAEQVEEQILPDGVQDELTPHYHAVVVNNILTCAESCEELGLALESRTLDTLRKMVRYQEQTVTPDRSAQVAFNDSDPESVPNVAARLRKIGLDDFVPEPETLGPEAYPYAGVAFLRQKSEDGDLYLAFDGGPFGRSHQHEDRLGFCLHAYGHNFIVDPGRHLYDRSEASFLPYLVTTHAHSTITIDGQGQNSRAFPETWIAETPGSLTFSQSANDVRASARYELGYGPDNEIDVIHHREVVFLEQSYWVLFDTIAGAGSHTIESRFQFGPGDIEVDDTNAVTRFADANLLIMASGDWDTRVLKGEQDPKAGWYSASYNKIEAAPALSLKQTCVLPLSYVVLLLPYRGTSRPEVDLEFDGTTATISVDGSTRAVQAQYDPNPAD